MSTGFDVQLATSDSWGDVERLFGRAGASNGCWCQYWLLGPDYHRRDRAENRQALAEQVRHGRAGLLAYRHNEPVGWVRCTPRSDLGWLTSGSAVTTSDQAILGCCPASSSLGRLAAQE